MPPEEPAPTAAKVDPVPGRARPAALDGLALAAGAVGGVVAWLGGEAIHASFEAPLFDSFNPRSREMGGLVLAGTTKEALLAFGMLGAALGLALGLAGGLVRARSGPRWGPAAWAWPSRPPRVPGPRWSWCRITSPMSIATPTTCSCPS